MTVRWWLLLLGLAACSGMAHVQVEAGSTVTKPEITEVAESVTFSASAFYLGREDTSGDGQVTFADLTSLYANHLSVEPVRLSQPDANVLQYDVTPDSTAAAYITQVRSVLALDIVQVVDLSVQRIMLEDLSAATVTAFDGVVWITGYDLEGLPLVRGFSTTDGELLGNQPLIAGASALDNLGTSIVLHDNTSSVERMSLPTFDTVPIELDGLLIEPPLWSPTEPKFAMVVSRQDNLSLLISNLDGTTSTIDLLDFDDIDRVSITWSSGGRYIIYSVRRMNEPDAPALMLVDIEAASIVSLQEPGYRLSVLGWSNNDASALVLEQPLAQNANDGLAFPEFLLYDTASQALTDLESMSLLEPLTLKWNPVEPVLGVLGQSLRDGRYGVYSLFTPEDSLSTLLSSFDASLTQGSLYWSPDGTQLVLALPSSDVVMTPLGTPFALFVLDTASSVVTRLSPVGVLVDVHSVTMR